MSQLQRQSLQAHTILLVTGAISVLTGLFMFAQRVLFARLFLGARFFFGVPVAEDDLIKLGLATAVALYVIVSGIVVLVAGLVYASKASSARLAVTQGDPATPTPR